MKNCQFLAKIHLYDIASSPLPWARLQMPVEQMAEGPVTAAGHAARAFGNDRRWWACPFGVVRSRAKELAESILEIPQTFEELANTKAWLLEQLRLWIFFLSIRGCHQTTSKLWPGSSQQPIPQALVGPTCYKRRLQEHIDWCGKFSNCPGHPGGHFLYKMVAPGYPAKPFF